MSQNHYEGGHLVRVAGDEVILSPGSSTDTSHTVIHSDAPASELEAVEWPHPFGYSLLHDLPPRAPRRGGSRMSRWIGKNVLRALGWKMEGPYPDVPKLVIVGGPHTSNWDGIIGIAAILALDIDVRVMAKHTLFRGPSGAILRRLGAIPVDRRTRRGIVEQMVERFGETDRLVLGITPEGTRKKVDAWKTGFYRIAEEAGVPILTVALDFGHKTIRLGPTLLPTGDIDADFALMSRFLSKALPKNPANA